MTTLSAPAAMKDHVLQAIVSMANRFQGGNWSLWSVEQLSDHAARITFHINDVSVTVEITAGPGPADEPDPPREPFSLNPLTRFGEARCLTHWPTAPAEADDGQWVQCALPANHVRWNPDPGCLAEDFRTAPGQPKIGVTGVD